MGDFRKLGLFAPEPLAEGHDFSEFTSGRPSLDGWLSDMALYNQRSNYTRTFVVRDQEFRVRAYYALCAGMMMRKDAPKIVAPHGAPAEIPIALLARFAVHKEVQGNGVGSTLLASALRMAASASQAVAFRAVIVDALDEDAARFYLKFGFKPTRISPLKLIMPTHDIVASLTG